MRRLSVMVKRKLQVTFYQQVVIRSLQSRSLVTYCPLFATRLSPVHDPTVTCLSPDCHLFITRFSPVHHLTINCSSPVVTSSSTIRCPFNNHTSRCVSDCSHDLQRCVSDCSHDLQRYSSMLYMTYVFILFLFYLKLYIRVRKTPEISFSVVLVDDFDI